MKKTIPVLTLLLIAILIIGASGVWAEQGREIGRDRRFIAYDNGTVCNRYGSMRLMWAAKDNGKDTNWKDAISYCENYRGGGYTDWRMPSINEMKRLYAKNEDEQSSFAPQLVTKLIEITRCRVWAGARVPSVALWKYAKPPIRVDMCSGHYVGVSGAAGDVPVRGEMNRTLPVRTWKGK